jgi:hypothetical protein
MESWTWRHGHGDMNMDIETWNSNTGAFCSVPKTKRWRWLKALWNGFFSARKEENTKLLHFLRLGKYIPYNFQLKPTFGIV